MVQTAALILELAPALYDAFKREDRYDVITGYLGLLLLTLTLTKSEKKDIPAFDALLQKDQRPATSWVPPRRKKIETLAGHFKKARAKSQRRFGLRSRDGKTLESMVITQTFRRGAYFMVDGVRYKLLKVYRAFTYHPAYGTKPASGKNVATSSYSPPLLLDGAGKKPLKTNSTKTIKLFELRIVGAGKKTVTDKPEDIDFLRKFARAMEARAFQVSMRNLGEAINTLIDLALDLAELIPGWGQAIAVARIVGRIIRFLTSGGFKEIKNILFKIPEQISQFLEKDLTALLSFDGLWTYILFGGTSFKRVRPEVNKARRKPLRRRKGAFARLWEIGRMIWRAVGKLVAAFGRVRQRVSAKFRGLQSFIVTRPRLAAAVRFIADFATRRISLVSNATALVARFQSFRKDFAGRIAGMLQKLQDFQLPTNIISLASIIEIVISSVILKFVPGTKGKAVRLALQVTGGDALIARAIESQLAAAQIDPNTFWQRIILPMIEKRVQSARDTLVGKLYAFLNKVPGLTGLRPPRFKPISVTKESFPEASPFPATQPIQADGPTHLRPPQGGTPLPSPVRASAEARFGHDFGHVRLHTGSEAIVPMATFAADGLATGSHVYLRPGLSPAIGRGSQVLDHELSHVLQQTGPRPLGRDHSPRPAMGRPGRGLHFSPVAEARADRIARASRTPSATWPLPIQTAASDGFQPDADYIVRRMLLELSSLEASEKRRKTIEKELAIRTEPESLDTQVKAVANEIWTKIKNEITHKRGKCVSFLKSVETPIKDYMDEYKEMIGKAIPFLAKDSQIRKIVRKRRAVRKSKRAAKKSEVVGINVQSFRKRLEAHIMVSLGIGARVEGKISSEQKKGRQEVTVKDLNLHYYYVYLAGLQAGGGGKWTKKLKTTAITNTWSNFELGTTSEERQKKIKRIRRWATVLSETEYQASPDVWKKSTYAFTKEFKDAVEDMLKAKGLPPQDLPPWKDYIKDKGSATKGFGHIGLRIGLHGDVSQAGHERESHHTTQYLLTEYFRNKKDKKPFFKIIEYGPAGSGLVWDSDGPSIFKCKGKKDVQIATLEKGNGKRERGAAMPAILIAASSHRIRALHVTARKDELKDKKTQSNSIHVEFKSHLHQDLKPQKTEAATQKGVDEYKATHGADAVERQIYAAMQKTYRWMHKQMETGFRLNFPGAEKKYYEQVAKDKFAPNAPLNTYRANLSKLTSIVGDAYDHNDRIMRASGWFET
jgi:hypothetical protein